MSFPVHVLSNDQLLRESICSHLRNSGYSCFEHGSLQETMQGLRHHKISCVLADIESLGGSPLELLKNIRCCDGSHKAVLLVSYARMATAVSALREGAIDMLDIPIDAGLLTRAIDAAHRNASHELRFTQLSPRERQILRLLINGLRNKEVAKNLGISHRTVDVFRSRIMTKLSVGTFAELCSIAIGYHQADNLV